MREHNEVPPGARCRNEHQAQNGRAQHAQRNAHGHAGHRRPHPGNDCRQRNDGRKHAPRDGATPSIGCSDGPHRQEPEHGSACRRPNAHERRLHKGAWAPRLLRFAIRGLLFEFGIGLGVQGPFLLCGLLFPASHQALQLVRALARAAQAGQQRFRELLHGGVALVGIGVQGGEHHVVHAGAQLFHAERGDDDLGIVDGVFRLGDAVGQKRVLARDHLVGKAGQCPFVAALVELFLLHLLGRHVADGAALGSAVARFARQSRQAEVGHLHVAFLVDEHVVGLDVQVEDVVRVRRLQCAGHRLEHGADHVRVHLIRVFGK